MHILLIDDSSSTRSLLRTLINSGQSSRHDISEAASGEEALQKVESGEINLPELIIMDINMGGMSGYDLCREFRRRHGASELVPYVIIVTANEGVDVIKQVLDAGANDYMPKPVNVKILHVRLLVAERLIAHAKTNGAAEKGTGPGLLGAGLSGGRSIRDPRDAVVTDAFENSDAPMAVVEAVGLDPTFRILYTNASMGFTTKFTPDQLIGKSLADLEAWTTEFIDMVVGFVSRGALLSYVPMWTRTRQDFQVYLSFYPIRKDDEAVTHYLVIHHL
jgi:CheY-like chemotaxis protein